MFNKKKTGVKLPPAKKKVLQIIINEIQMQDNLPYSTEHVCPKCGNVDMDIKYVEEVKHRTTTWWNALGTADSWTHNENYVPAEDEHVVQHVVDVHVYPEHLSVTCTRCGYEAITDTRNQATCNYCGQMSLESGTCKRCGAPRGDI